MLSPRVTEKFQCENIRRRGKIYDSQTRTSRGASVNDINNGGHFKTNEGSGAFQKS